MIEKTAFVRYFIDTPIKPTTPRLHSYNRGVVGLMGFYEKEEHFKKRRAR